MTARRLTKERILELRRSWSRPTSYDADAAVNEALDAYEALAAERDTWQMKAEALLNAAQIQTVRPSVVEERDRYRAALETILHGELAGGRRTSGAAHTARDALLAADDKGETK